MATQTLLLLLLATATPAFSQDPSCTVDRVASVTSACCPGGNGCLLTSTAACSVTCARVLLPLVQECSLELALIGGTGLAAQLAPACEQALTPAVSGPVGTNCEYEDLLPVSMACSGYIGKTAEALTTTNAAFCTSLCYEQAAAFHIRCAQKMTYVMKLSLGSVETVLDQTPPVCHAKDAGGYDAWDTAICESTGAAEVVNAACADASALLPGVPTGDPSADDPRLALCNSGCATAVGGLSSACKRDPVFAPVISIADACTDIHEGAQCTDVAASFAMMVATECCKFTSNLPLVDPSSQAIYSLLVISRDFLTDYLW